MMVDKGEGQPSLADITSRLGMDHSYKASKQAFVSELSGSNITHVLLISLVAWVTIALDCVLRSRLTLWRNASFTSGWIVLVFPLLLSMTIFANTPGLFALSLCVPVCALLFLGPPDENVSLPSTSPVTATGADWANLSFHRIPPLPALTTYRAHMMLMTILAILAVDFPVFPRSLAKCETYGVSLMDLGVGSFVFGQGVVSAIPLLKNPSYLISPMTPKFVSVVRKCLPIIFLGLVRVILVKGTDYPEHETEYGVHWNFFITLALMPILQVLLHPLIVYVPVSTLGVIVASLQQISLSHLGMERFVRDAPRMSLISANKEGIASTLGYLSIHLLGLSLGTMILPPSPSHFRRVQRQLRSSGRDEGQDKDISLARPRQNDKTATELVAYMFVWWISLWIAKFFQTGLSRQLVNLPYILWVTAYNTTFVLGYLLLDIYFAPSPTQSNMLRPKKLKSERLDVDPRVPPSPQVVAAAPLLEAVNKNGLALFLFANILTGFVNLTIRTMYTSDFWAMVILSGYAYAVCTAAWTFRGRRVINL